MDRRAGDVGAGWYTESYDGHPMRRRQQCDMRHAERVAGDGLRPGNFKNVIQNIWYLFAMSDTRCSVSGTDRPPRYTYRSGSAGAPESGAIGIPTARRGRTGQPGIAEVCGPLKPQRHVVPDELPVSVQ
ncbi:hypothetical protein MPUL_05240 [Mycolicibacterium pulveris]|uniref:Uncharacterized protein n=1 Tax=Mycolicibacterium pulveris TaxID=36813 RepID=A0A7I7UGS1_MYCPV|nr:hypothetical protein MPUL_05240 [Mycolicibacterium pulveris]